MQIATVLAAVSVRIIKSSVPLDTSGLAYACFAEA
jgi:hypothetical protein